MLLSVLFGRCGESGLAYLFPEQNGNILSNLTLPVTLDVPFQCWVFNGAVMKKFLLWSNAMYMSDNSFILDTYQRQIYYFETLRFNGPNPVL